MEAEILSLIRMVDDMDLPEASKRYTLKVGIRDLLDTYIESILKIVNYD